MPGSMDLPVRNERGARKRDEKRMRTSTLPAEDVPLLYTDACAIELISDYFPK
jgi:hypothetical protein